MWANQVSSPLKFYKKQYILKMQQISYPNNGKITGIGTEI